MDKLLYIVARALITLIQSLPLLWVARLGRLFGTVAYWLDARHRRVAQRNLTMCFGQEKSAAEIREIAKENFRRIGENFASALKPAGTIDHCEWCAMRILPGQPSIVFLSLRMPRLGRLPQEPRKSVPR